MVVDTLGFVMGVVVSSAGVQDRDGAKLVRLQVLALWTRLNWIWADGAYGGQLLEWAWKCGAWMLVVVKRNSVARGWQVLPHRWIVERTFGWLGRYRRLSKDYEGRTDVSETWIRIAMIKLMVRRLAPPQGARSERTRRRVPKVEGKAPGPLPAPTIAERCA